MSVYKRKNSKFYYCELTVPETNRKIIRSTKTTNKALARRFEQQLREKLYRQHYFGELPRITINEAIGMYEQQKSQQVTLRNLKSQVTALKQQLARVVPLESDLHTITSQNLLHLVHLRGVDGVKNGTLHQLLVSIRAMIKVCTGSCLTPINLVFPQVKVKNGRVRVLSKNEEYALLNVLQPTRNNHTLDSHDLVVLLIDSGARLNEIQGLDWKDVDLEGGFLKLWRSKTNSETLIKLTTRSMAVLLRRNVDSTSSYVFPSTTGGLRQCAPKRLQDAYKNIGLDGFKTHDLRHTAASRWVQNGLSLQEVGYLLGHSNVAMTQRYAHLDGVAVAEKAAALIEM